MYRGELVFCSLLGAVGCPLLDVKKATYVARTFSLEAAKLSDEVYGISLR